MVIPSAAYLPTLTKPCSLAPPRAGLHQGAMLAAPNLSTVAETIQVAIAPVFLLAGIGALLNVITGRLARIVDRSRALERLHPQTTGPEHDRHVWELRRIDRRVRVIQNAIALATASGVAVCCVVALLFVAELLHLRIGRTIALIFILAMVLLIASLVCFLIEVRLSVKVTRIRAELLERER